MLSYDEYTKLVIEPVEESAFDVLILDATALLSNWTLDRLSEPLSAAESLVLARLVNGLDSMRAGTAQLNAGESVKSYSNGVSSWSFDTPFSGTAYDYEIKCKQALYDMAVEYLPVELISRVVEQGCGCACRP